MNVYMVDLNRFDKKLNKSPFLEIANYLNTNGFKVKILTGKESNETDDGKYSYLIKTFHTSGVPGFFKIFLLLKIGKWLLSESNDNDILWVSPGSLYIGCIVKKLRGARIHLDIRTLPVEIHGLSDRLSSLVFYYFPLKLLIYYVDSFSFITKRLKNSVENSFSKKFTKYIIWESGVCLDKYLIANKNQDRNGEKIVIAYLGVITKNRGLNKVIEGISLLSSPLKNKIEFQIIGHGNYLEDLVSLTKSLCLEGVVKFVGKVSYDEVPNCLHRIDYGICPLPNRPEWNVSSPLKVFEYIASSKPVILTPIVAHLDVLNEQQFVIWTSGYEAEDFSRSLEYAVENYYSLKEVAKNGPSFIRGNYDWSTQGAKICEYLKRRYC